MTDPLRQTGSRHYDYEQGLCEAPSDGAERSRPVQEAVRSPDSNLGRSGASGGSEPPAGARDVALRLAANVSAKQPADPGLCERRLRTNDLLCKVLGGAVAFRAPGPAKIFAAPVASECVRAWQWLEEHAPGGACGTD